MKRVIFRYGGGIVSCLLNQDNKLIELYPYQQMQQSRLTLGNIYMGKVKSILKNINAAFVDIGDDQICFLPLNDVLPQKPEEKEHALFGQRNYPQRLCPGDELAVQIIQEPIKTKQATVSSQLSFTGRYCVLLTASKGVNISKKINDREWRKKMKQELLPYTERDFGVILRTNSYEVSENIILEELEGLFQEYQRILSVYAYRPAYTQLYSAAPSWLTDIRDTRNTSLESIETDDADLYQILKDYIAAEFEQDISKLRLVEETVPLRKKYSLEKAITEALSERVWLSSGAYIVIQPTEALVVIDVNTGKSVKKKDMQQHILHINMEAAKEVLHQIRLRNLSGIILVDFINMKSSADKEQLLNYLAQGLREDPVKTVLVGMSQLELVQITRQKVRKALHETFLAQRMEDVHMSYRHGTVEEDVHMSYRHGTVGIAQQQIEKEGECYE